MVKCVNYADNIYMLFTRIKMVREYLVLDADPGLFVSKILDDIEFTDKTLETLFNEISGNLKLIERDELLSHLSELELQFGEFLSNFLLYVKKNSGNIDPKNKELTEEYHQQTEKIASFQAKNSERKKIAAESASTVVSSEFGTAAESLVSVAEHNELLKAF